MALIDEQNNRTHTAKLLRQIVVMGISDDQSVIYFRRKNLLDQNLVRIFAPVNLNFTVWSDTIKPYTQGDIMKPRKGVVDGTEIHGRI